MKFLIIMIWLLTGCAHQLPVVRSEYQLIRVDDFLISNSYVHPSELKKLKAGPLFHYQIIVKNLLPRPREIDFSKAFLMIGLRKIPLYCHALQDKFLKTQIGPEETRAILCEIQLNKAEGMFQISDYRAMVDIPLVSRSVQFPYLLRVEDFQ